MSDVDHSEILRFAEEAMRNQEASLHALIENTTDFIWSIDGDYRLMIGNGAFHQLYALLNGHSLNKGDCVLPSSLPTTIRDKWQKWYDRTLAGEHFIVEDIFGTAYITKCYEHSFNPIVTQEGQVRGVTVLSRDISERKKTEQLKNEFISVVSHELRTPLTSIIGSLAMLDGGVAGQLPLQAKTLIAIAYRNSDRLIRLINDILDMEKIASGKMVFDCKVYEVMALVRRSLQINHGYAEQYGVRLVLTEVLPGAQVYVDGDRFEQVLSNLFSNAAKFSPSGGMVEICVYQLDTMVRIAVQDSGPGIPPEFRLRVFEKFAQADSSDTRQKGGTGLGLSICKEIISRMNGTIDFISEPGKGTTFFFDLPLWRSEAVSL